MSAMRDVMEFTRQIVSECGLHTASVFVCDRSESTPALRYLAHVNVPEQAQHSYLHEGVFCLDPFTDTQINQRSGDGDLILGRELTMARKSRCADYWSFIDHFNIDIVAASSRELAPGVVSTLGFHHRSDKTHQGDVPIARLREMAMQLQDMVAASMLRTMMSQPQARTMWQQCMFGAPVPSQAATHLSPREAEIVAFICKGRLNKEIAYLTGLSEYTIENHLRRIYRKFGVRNRTALVAAMSGSAVH